MPGAQLNKALSVQLSSTAEQPAFLAQNYKDSTITHIRYITTSSMFNIIKMRIDDLGKLADMLHIAEGGIFWTHSCNFLSLTPPALLAYFFPQRT